MPASIEVVNGDVLSTPCDALVLKYAQGFYGADLAVARTLGMVEEGIKVASGDHVLIAATGRLSCKNVLFLGVDELFSFGYAEIRKFALDSMAALGATGVGRDVVAMTVRGNLSCTLRAEERNTGGCVFFPDKRDFDGAFDELIWYGQGVPDPYVGTVVECWMPPGAATCRRW